jgi:hypothetical protein
VAVAEGIRQLDGLSDMIIWLYAVGMTPATSCPPKHILPIELSHVSATTSYLVLRKASRIAGSRRVVYTSRAELTEGSGRSRAPHRVGRPQFDPAGGPSECAPECDGHRPGGSLRDRRRTGLSQVSAVRANLSSFLLNGIQVGETRGRVSLRRMDAGSHETLAGVVPER